MEASLDTNVIIHFYNANLQFILFNRFEKIKVYEFIRKQEIEKHASSDIKKLFDKDVSVGKIDLVTEDYIRNIGMHNVFHQHVQNIRILFNVQDLGEVYAIALAMTLGCISIITDDIKERGPHYTLMRMHDLDVIPFAFYELLFLDYLEEKITERELLNYFTSICYTSNISINILSKLKIFIKRFWTNPYRKIEKEWMIDFCIKKNIDAKPKLQYLNNFLNEKL